ncbi:mediator of RNA polymerase II transcription subunit 10 isoform X1 [Chlorocebus sabaeus]
MIYFPFPYQVNHTFFSSVSPLMCNPLPAFSSRSSSGNSVLSPAGRQAPRNFIVTGLQDIDKCRQQLHDITVPLEVFEYIDQGRNPQLYTKECLERALAKNEQVKGKIDTMKKFKSLLIQELSKVFPEDMAKYRSIRGEDHLPS